MDLKGLTFTQLLPATRLSLPEIEQAIREGAKQENYECTEQEIHSAALGVFFLLKELARTASQSN